MTSLPEPVRGRHREDPNHGAVTGTGPITEHIARGERRRHGRGGLGTQRGDGWARTAEDEQLLAACVRYGAVTLRQAAERFWGGSFNTARQRVQYMREAGLLNTTTEARWAGTVLWATAAGTRVAAVDLRAPEWPGERLLHRLAVTDVGFRFEHQGLRVVTERELRKAEMGESAVRLVASLGVREARPTVDGAGRTRYLCVAKGARGEIHFPDLVLAQPGGMSAVEVEITPKRPAELRRILRGYKDAGQALFRQVIYLCTNRVAMLLHGYRDPDTGQWHDGLVQEVGLLPAGQPRYGPDSPLRVRPLPAADPGVGWQLDLRQVPDTWRVGLDEWRTLRARWASDTVGGEPAEVPFLLWWERWRQHSRVA